MLEDVGALITDWRNAPANLVRRLRAPPMGGKSLSVYEELKNENAHGAHGAFQYEMIHL